MKKRTRMWLAGPAWAADLLAGLKRAAWLGLLLSGITPAGAAPDDYTTDGVRQAGDTLQVGIPIVAFGLTFLMGGDDEDTQDSLALDGGPRLSLDDYWFRMNGSPRHDLALAIARTELVTYGLKYGVNAERPNGGGQSFPSGHTSVAFAGAEFMRKQYGWTWGVPFYLAAGYVGWSRVETRAHWTEDVLAGAAIGVLSNHDLLSFSIPFGTLQVAPTLMSDPGRTAAYGLVPDPDVINARAGLNPGLKFELQF